MKRALAFITLSLVVPAFALGQNRDVKMQDEVLEVEKEFSQAIVKNDAEAVGRFLADDWIIIDPDGGIIDRAAFLGVMKSGALTHEMMESDDDVTPEFVSTGIPQLSRH